MANKQPKRPAVKASGTLTKLRRLYGRQQLQNDVFGRRIALPSEIANQLRKSKPAVGGA